MIKCPSYIAKRKDGLTFRLFSYFSLTVVLILALQGLAEQALVKTTLQISQDVKAEMRQMAHEANEMIEFGDMDELADWSNAQDFYLFVLDSDWHPITHRNMHPHFEFKLQFRRNLDQPMGSQVSRPIIYLPLRDGHSLVIQLPHELHPAHDFLMYFTISKIVIAIVIMALFSLILSKNLQRPLDRLRYASQRLASGDFEINVVNELQSSIREFNGLAHDFDDMKREIELLSRKQRQLIRDVSHELRTPLARQNLVLHLLKSKVDDKDISLVERLESETNELNGLVTQILEFSRLENAKYKQSFKKQDLDILIPPQVERYRIDLKPSQTLNLDIQSTVSRVHCDEMMVTSCLNNLIGNAIKYAGEQASIQVTLYTKFLDSEEYAFIEVSDDGEGIPDNRLGEMFDPFTRLQSSRDKTSGGYGLGLAIVKKSMRAMAGKVYANNNTQGGLSVKLAFPLAI